MALSTSKALPEPVVDITLPVGEFNIPFSFQLPKELPSSMVSLSGDDYIAYSIYAHIDIAWKQDPSTRHFFTVIQHQAPSLYRTPATLRDNNYVVYSQFCCIPTSPEGKLNVTLSTPASSYAPGETAKLRVDIQSDWLDFATNWGMISVHFNQVVTCWAEGRTQTYRKPMMMPHQIYNTTTVHDPNSTGSVQVLREISIPIPVTPPTYLGGLGRDSTWLGEVSRYGGFWSMKSFDPIVWKYEAVVEIRMQQPGMACDEAVVWYSLPIYVTAVNERAYQAVQQGINIFNVIRPKPTQIYQPQIRQIYNMYPMGIPMQLFVPMGLPGMMMMPMPGMAMPGMPMQPMPGMPMNMQVMNVQPMQQNMARSGMLPPLHPQSMQMMPGQPMPGQPMPGQMMLPGQMMSQQMMPQQMMPQQMMPQQMMPGHIMPGQPQQGFQTPFAQPVQSFVPQTPDPHQRLIQASTPVIIGTPYQTPITPFTPVNGQSNNPPSPLPMQVNFAGANTPINGNMYNNHPTVQATSISVATPQIAMPVNNNFNASDPTQQIQNMNTNLYINPHHETNQFNASDYQHTAESNPAFVGIEVAESTTRKVIRDPEEDFTVEDELELMYCPLYFKTK
jgi:hypothetical protein